jgi:hypothetical protein
MNTRQKFLCLGPILAIVLFISILPANALSQDRLRVIIETDAGGDPDDEQSLVRFLLYANEWDVEGIIANRRMAREGENHNRERTGLGIVRQHLKAYESVYPSLVKHSPTYPKPEELNKRTVNGLSDSDDAVNLIIEAADRDDPRPIWFQNWGTDHGSDPSNLKRALDKILAERGPEGYSKFKNKFLLSSDDQFGPHTSEIKPPWRLWIQPGHPRIEGKPWYHRFSPLTEKAGGFDLKRDVLTNHGPLGALYPTNTHLPQKEGDSLMFLYLIPTGMNDPLHPTWGSWAGRFGVREGRPEGANYYWANLADDYAGKKHRDQTLTRWAADLQNDFRARLDWCVSSYANANHPPIAYIDDDGAKEIKEVQVRPGIVTQLDGSRSIDPDENKLAFHWLVYPEAGTYEGPVVLKDASEPKTTIEIPLDAKGKSIHVILTVRDNGAPPLAAYRRVTLKVD